MAVPLMKKMSLGGEKIGRCTLHKARERRDEKRATSSSSEKTGRCAF